MCSALSFSVFFEKAYGISSKQSVYTNFDGLFRRSKGISAKVDEIVRSEMFLKQSYLRNLTCFAPVDVHVQYRC